jgi:hypothetical protein
MLPKKVKLKKRKDYIFALGNIFLLVSFSQRYSFKSVKISQIVETQWYDLHVSRIYTSQNVIFQIFNTDADSRKGRSKYKNIYTSLRILLQS